MAQLTKKNLFILLTMLVSLLIALLLVISVYLVQPKVEEKLISSVKLALAEYNIEAEVSFSGRDGILTGEVANQDALEKAHKLSLAVFGTRVIKNHLSVRAKKRKTIKVDANQRKARNQKISYLTVRQRQ